MKELLLKDVKRIGIFRSLYLGDMLCIIPTVRALRCAYPDATIYLVGLSWQRDFVKRFSKYFDEFIEFPGWPGLPEQEFDTNRILEFLDSIRELKLDLLLQMQGNGTITNSMCLLWGAEHIAGLRTASAKPYSANLFPVSEDGEHEVLRFFKLLDVLGIPRKGDDLEFPITEEEQLAFMQVSADLDLVMNQYVCLHPGARDARRRWPIENFAYIGNKLLETGHKIVLTGSVQETDILNALEAKIHAPVINIVRQIGDVPLGILAATIENSRLLISNDTGVSHIAAGLRHPSVIIFSPYSDVNRWAPLNSALHRVILAEKATDPEYALYCILDQLQKSGVSQSSLLLDEI